MLVSVNLSTSMLHLRNDYSYSTKGIICSICYSMDDSSLYVHYFNTVFNLIDGKSSEPNFNTCNGEKLDRTVADCAGFLQQLQAQNLSQLHSVRGPYLAQLEFFSILRAKGENAEQYFGN